MARGLRTAAALMLRNWGVLLGTAASVVVLAI
jgi:hypothetical protein